MRRLLPILFFLSCAAAWGVGILPRSVSTSRQFTVYCENKLLRLHVTTFAEEMKAAVLDLLGETDGWKHPIIIQITEARTALPDVPPSNLRLLITEAGPKIQIDVSVGKDPASVALQPQIIRALLLEYIHREKGPRAGATYAEPPNWLVAAVAERERRRVAGGKSGIFGTLAASSQLPPVKKMLTASPGTPGSTWNQLFRAYSFCLLEILLEQPDARGSLRGYLRDLRKAQSDPVSALAKRFPAVGASDESLEKWWALSVARLSAMDDARTISEAERDLGLEMLLVFELPKKDDLKEVRFELADYREHAKDPRFMAVLNARQVEALALATKVNPLFRPIVAEYQDIFSRLARGKHGGLDKRIAAAAEYREAVLKTIEAVADYLNWVEATQMQTRSHDFDAYFHAAMELERRRTVRTDPVTRYMDLAEALTK